MTFCLVAGSMFVTSIARAEQSDSDISWGQRGIGVWRYDSGSGAWVDLPAAGPEDPKQYKFELLCLDPGQNNFDKACLAAAADCKEGENGRPVRWFESLKILDPPAWAAIRPDRCLYSEKPTDVLEKIAAQIQSKFEQLPITPAVSGIQPFPHTLRGAETNFYAEASEQAFTVDMLGQKVVIKAEPVEYRWDYGDGATLGPGPTMGGPLPEERWGEKTRTSHAYAGTDDYWVVLTTTFRGTYSVNGGPDMPIPGTGQFASPFQKVSVWRSITRNYADNCIVNPRGEGCPGVP
ncbi:PKD domain-containing protein [Arthrobacter sp. Hiyo1]|uniref:PKD domain-containing protein n=1 Tax=Arthrobacter sp. Hiyo1 TaxID=1588020 RepID=UPI00209C0F6B|nr:PKD domain-containing protein [Arthrobacter sp. Hiyo1]